MTRSPELATLDYNGRVPLAPVWPKHSAGDLALLIVETGSRPVTLSDGWVFVQEQTFPVLPRTWWQRVAARLGFKSIPDERSVGIWYKRATSDHEAAPVFSFTPKHALLCRYDTHGEPWDLGFDLDSHITTVIHDELILYGNCDDTINAITPKGT